MLLWYTTTIFILINRIAITTREGCNLKIQLERFHEALSDGASGLTYPALAGVTDAERLFSTSLNLWFCQKGYKAEAEYVEVINNWHWAVDERGLTERE